ncbi:hypothetical protein [uncultured Clostridium sp.]|uniref:hypothetical protein n=1 Tax=uncultured Clostridium sp. TaxID=59620 RepID=UPI0025F82CA3|nr:hypothetical protein [uncultured Clostridium sp.]
MGVKIFDYIESGKLESYKKSLETNEIKDIYRDDNIRISLWKKGRKVYTFIDEFGDKKLDNALNEMCNLV